MENDTIAAISTPVGEGGIAVIRVSGPEAVEVVDRVYKGKRSLTEVDTHTVHYGHILHPETKEVLDEVLVTVMRAPRTFTREDVVEVSCHGGVVPVQKVLEALLTAGARLAEPGEFTKRAFLNGRIDLSQAEAVIDLIRSKTDRAARVAMDQARGRLSRLIRKLRQEILETLAHLAVNVDYPEYDAEELTAKTLLSRCRQIEGEILRLLETARQGKILRDGIATVIVGRPNVGKSSLLNALSQENKAIVTDIPGTTRDVIEEYVNVRGIPLRLVDTAGIRETEDVVERIGVERSRRALEQADLVLLVLNYAEPLTEDDRKLLEAVRSHTAIVVVNKTDLERRIDLEEVRRLIGDTPLVTLSLKEERGLDRLEEAIGELFFAGKVEGTEATYVSNVRHIHLLERALGNVRDAIAGIEGNIPLDMVEIDLKNAWQHLGEIIGEAVSEDLIDQIFSQFCLGK
ncbi:tRNA modification GTPase [Planifilum fulgidum]|jgi:tRNA modification GTPase|uniref:tRNA modification GTPase MnmE n=1 Tax=Planifilum fulgidum TaxID=201973 RepID=A0A1I2LF91_9BACL|nr:tRNA uridine-5-carboxymethylaminomethyl(34) synthesis GTPase MnmE [Planifilum fulgidum]MBO2496424.1 tRNA uridine-5-carboxymethylaminomethyl(34) synthesis GTPase MnmE [Bacillota bacterium]MBO2531286.1 tRNA uridine-5-carboxymethylaminomethyl(34) synthesis GTPase MnmE [Thermoactinomycetaceae bacterium]SFF77955.1 tRNA modification GTPase [Planifilum fulgidum]